MKTLFKRPIALPQDHGSWVFILSPLLIGLFASDTFNLASLALVVAAMAAFLLRQPITIAIKAYSGRRPRSDLPAARFWMAAYGLIALLSVSELVYLGYAFILWLAVPAVPIFGWHLWLVSRREERRQAGVEILATGVLALAAPAALWAGRGSYDPAGWVLWALTWLQSAASIVYAYLRLHQRELKTLPDKKAMWQMGARAAAYTTFNVFAALGLAAAHLAPPLIVIPFLVQWGETLWGITHPAMGAKPTAIGIRQLIVSTLFTVLFIVTWRM
ncbi:MAG: YwiC-like family protein [Anaerolineales bacterium]